GQVFITPFLAIEKQLVNIKTQILVIDVDLVIWRCSESHYWAQQYGNWCASQCSKILIRPSHIVVEQLVDVLVTAVVEHVLKVLNRESCQLLEIVHIRAAGFGCKVLVDPDLKPSNGGEITLVNMPVTAVVIDMLLIIWSCHEGHDSTELNAGGAPKAVIAPI